MDDSGAWDGHTHATFYKTDNQQGSSVKHRELYSTPCNNLCRKKSEKGHTCV